MATVHSLGDFFLPGTSRTSVDGSVTNAISRSFMPSSHDPSLLNMVSSGFLAVRGPKNEITEVGVILSHVFSTMVGIFFDHVLGIIVIDLVGRKYYDPSQPD
ncbi:unnamed protein product [Linum trigynum]|uniref:Uncharacterized protein n=1 Tax=Linum trigynum TaxID=586398 RepID=A0AAV2D3M9_9ROSI